MVFPRKYDLPKILVEAGNITFLRNVEAPATVFAAAGRRICRRRAMSKSLIRPDFPGMGNLVTPTSVLRRVIWSAGLQPACCKRRPHTARLCQGFAGYVTRPPKLQCRGMRAGSPRSTTRDRKGDSYFSPPSEASVGEDSARRRRGKAADIVARDETRDQAGGFCLFDKVVQKTRAR